MPIPDFQTAMRPLLAVAVDAPVRMPEVEARLADQFGLRLTERAELIPSGRQRLFYNRLAWAKFHLTKAGMLDTPSQGSFRASAAGRRLLGAVLDRVDMAVLRQHSKDYTKLVSREPTALPAANASATLDQMNASTPNDQIISAVGLIREKLKADLREHISTAGPARFERLIRDLLVAMEYGEDLDADRERPGGSDGGIDGVISQDKLGLDRIYLQAKLYTDAKVTRPAIQAFVGSLVGHGANKGVFVTMTDFTREAREFASGLRERVVLIDGDRLCDLLIEHGVAVREDKPIILKQLDYSYFIDEA